MTAARMTAKGDFRACAGGVLDKVAAAREKCFYLISEIVIGFDFFKVLARCVVLIRYYV